MEDHISCPLCRRTNLAENLFCGQCGASLATGKQLTSRSRSSLTVGGKYSPPSKLNKSVGRALALGLAALATEAGLSWLRRRNERFNQPAPVASRSGASAGPEHLANQSAEEIFVWLQEEVFRRSVFTQRVVKSSNISKLPGHE